MKAEYAQRLEERDRESLALWAAECAEHVLPYFEDKCSEDDRTRKAFEAARLWARGQLSVSKAREAAFAAHAAARQAGDAAATAAARAAGHAAATAHVADHARHAATYAVKAACAAADPADRDRAAAGEYDWQYSCLPEHLRPLALPTAANVPCGPQDTGSHLPHTPDPEAEHQSRGSPT